MFRRIASGAVALLAALSAAAGPRFQVKTIAVGPVPARPLALTEIGLGLILVGNHDGLVSVVDVARDVVVDSFQTGGRCDALVLDAAAQQVYVVGPNLVQAYAWSTDRFTLAGEIATDIEWAKGVELDPANRRLLLTDGAGIGAVSEGASAFRRFDNLLAESDQLLMDPVGKRVFAPQAVAGSVSVLDAVSMDSLMEVQSAPGAVGVAYSARHDRLFIVNPRFSWLHNYELASGNEEPSPFVGIRPSGLILDDDQDVLWVGSASSAFVTRVDAATVKPSYITIPAPAASLVLDAGARRLFALDSINSQVSLVDTGTDALVATYPLGANSHFAIVESGSHKLYTSNLDEGTVSILTLMPSPGKTVVTATPELIPADSASTSRILVIPYDENGQPLGPGQDVQIDSTAGAFTGPVVDRGDGSYTRDLQATSTVETAIVSAFVDKLKAESRPRVSFQRDGWPDVRNTEPDWGLWSGGTRVTIRGQGFDPENALALGVLFDGIPATLDPSSLPTDTEIVCFTPAHTAGVVDVTVVRNLGDFKQQSSLRGGYLYVDSDQLQLKMTKGPGRGEVRLHWSDGPSGPVRMLSSPAKDCASDVTETSSLEGPETTDSAPLNRSVIYYRIER